MIERIDSLVMNEYGYNAFKVKFREGEIHPFKVLSKIILQDNEEYFVLEDENKQKHFLAVFPYSKYGLVPEKFVHCTIDRINCTGRIFLEPLHPCYRPGEVYSFKVLEIQKMENNYRIITADCFGNEVHIPFSGTEPVPLIVSGKIISIKKGLVEVVYAV